MGRTATLGNSLYRQRRLSPTPKSNARISRDGRDPSAWCRSVERGVREPVEWVASVLPVTPKPRYVTPLREGGSLPAIVEADDLGTYVLKFRGAGQGRKALVAELVAGEIA